MRGRADRAGNTATIRCQPTDKVSADKAAGAGDQNGLATRSLGRLSFTLISRHRGGLVFQAATPKRAPTAAVNTIARAPQKATRMTDANTGAPPARAATRPNSARKRSELPARPHIGAEAGSTRTIRRGRAAPTANVPAEANAACTGRAAKVSEIPSSSRPCAASASCCINWVETCDASDSSRPRLT